MDYSSSSVFPFDGDEQITTLFCVGFPQDFTDRELQHMFCFANGYSDSQLQLTTKGPIGFVRFGTTEQTQNALQFLNGRDMGTGWSCKCSISRTQLRERKTKKRSLDSAFPSINSTIQQHLSNSSSSHNNDNKSSSYPSSSSSLSDHYTQSVIAQALSMSALFSQQQQNSSSSSSSYPMMMPAPSPLSQGAGADTLYITGFTDLSSEAELRTNLGEYAGLVAVKWTVRPGKQPICFCKFMDNMTAKNALAALNGHALPSTSGQPLAAAFAHQSLSLKVI